MQRVILKFGGPVNAAVRAMYIHVKFNTMGNQNLFFFCSADTNTSTRQGLTDKGLFSRREHS
jgi:hypothetical protein